MRTDRQAIRKMKIAKLIMTICGASFFIQCESPHFYQQQKSTGDNWNKDSALTYNFEVKDTAEKYDFFLLSRNNNQYPYSNLYLITELKTPKGERFKDTIQYFLAFPDGEWIGKGNSLKELFLLYRENVTLKDTGRYNLKVWHGMREDQLYGIEDMSLIIDKK